MGNNWVFDTILVQGCHGDTPNIEDLDFLFFKKVKTCIHDEYINELKLNGFSQAKYIKINGIGCFIEIKLPTYYKKYISDYEKFKEFNIENSEKIKNINETLNLPEEFVAFCFWNENNKN